MDNLFVKRLCDVWACLTIYSEAMSYILSINKGPMGSIHKASDPNIQQRKLLQARSNDGNNS